MEMRSSFLSSEIVDRSPLTVNSKSISGLLPDPPSAKHLPWRIDLFLQPGGLSDFPGRGELVQSRSRQGQSQPVRRALFFPPLLKMVLDERSRRRPLTN